MNDTLTKSRKLQGLPWACVRLITDSLFMQLALGSVFILFLNELGMPKNRIGVIMCFLPFCGFIALMVASRVSRMGLKRIFIASCIVKTSVIALVILSPWVLSQVGPSGTFAYVAMIILVFAVCNSIAQTGYNPWSQEFIPEAIRGRFDALSSLLGTIAAIFAATGAGMIIETGSGLTRFQWVLFIGVVFGVISVLAAGFIPGERPSEAEGRHGASFRGMVSALQDKKFSRYLGGLAFVNLSIGAMVFVPLFLVERIGISEGKVVMLQNAAAVGILLSSLVWGWCADRYGSKPVLITGMSVGAAVPILYLLIPRGGPTSIYLAATVLFIGGIAGSGVGIGSSRLLFVDLIPASRRVDYNAVNLACVGIMTGMGSLLAGSSLDILHSLQGAFQYIAIDPYALILTFCALLMAASLVMFTRVKIAGGSADFQF